jgi:alkylation response protein AidB-like acyl-CoA dehydrogenase
MSALADLYTVPQDLLDFRDTIRQIAREQIAPRAAEIDRTSEYPWDLRKLLSDQDILGLPFEEEHGGTGTGSLMLSMAIEEIAKADASVALMLMVQDLGTLPIKVGGTDEQRDRFFPKCACGEWSPAFALSEPEAGSDPGGMITHAKPDGDDWVINGSKCWISNAGIADFYTVFAVTDREAGHSRGITCFIVESDRPGFNVASYEHKLGIHGSPTGTLTFDDVRVPAENVVGEVNRGFKVAMATLERSRLGAAAQAVGIAQGATDYAVAYAKERKQFGKPLMALQAIQFKLADMEAKTAAARELLYQASAKLDRNAPDMNKYTSMAKLISADTAMDVTVEAVQVLGGYGYTNDYPVERMMRDAKITQIYEGTSEIQRLVISRSL